MSALSIVIPTYDTAAMTLACCRAAVAAAPEAEVIVVDDASTDGTSALLAAEPVRVIRLEENRRFAGAANAGVAASRGQIILLLNSDTRIERDALSALVAAFAHPKLGIAGAQLLNPDGTEQWSGGPLPTLPWLFIMVHRLAPLLRRLLWSGGRSGRRKIDWVSGAAMAIRREVWQAAGPFNESYRFYAQDLELCARATALGWHVRLVENARVVHEGGATLRDPELLRLDLLQWGRAHYGRLWELVARLVTSKNRNNLRARTSVE